MTRILAIPGSLRRQSFNRGLAETARELSPEGVSISVQGIEGIPLYNGDDEAVHGMPPAVTALKDAIVAADAVLLVTPEYNNGIPGVFKNAIDWLSRPSADIARIFTGRPFAVIGASPGNFGTILSQDAWLPVLRTLGARPWFGGRLMVSGAAQRFDAEGRLADEATAERLRAFLSGYAGFIRG